MIKNILWDFDGVILDSMKIKGDGFVELFKSYDKESVEKLERYHYTNGGISRFDKILYFYENILNEKISKSKIEALANEFGQIIEKKLFSKKALINETVNFIKSNHKKYNFHIVSGAEHNELKKLCIYFELTNYFISINGSPIKKEILINDILIKYKYKKDETVLIGDALSDYNASVKNSIPFYGYNNEELIVVSHRYIESFNKIFNTPLN